MTGGALRVTCCSRGASTEGICGVLGRNLPGGSLPYRPEAAKLAAARHADDSRDKSARPVLRTAVKWGHLRENPARGVDLPKLRSVRPNWALTRPQAAALRDALPAMPRPMVGLAILSGLRVASSSRCVGGTSTIRHAC